MVILQSSIFKNYLFMNLTIILIIIIQCTNFSYGLINRRVRKGLTAARISNEYLIIGSNDVKNDSLKEKSYSVLQVLLPWLYFMSVNINLATMPSYVHWAMGTSIPQSSRVYGNMIGNIAFSSLFSILLSNIS